MPQFVIVKRWALREGHSESELLDLAREDVAPHYDSLPGCLGLGLLRIRGTRSYLAMQYWESREAWKSATSSDSYSEWLDEPSGSNPYEPSLERWNIIMEFEDEWETEDALG